MSNEPKKPKYAAGDTVTIHGRFGVVQDVHEELYFYSSDQVYYEYSVRFDNGDVFRYAEPILDRAAKPANICECGAWAVSWMDAQHSRWCPLHKPFERE